jgi:hypothetical protein
MVTTKQIFIGITITSITIFICSQFIKFEISNNKGETDTDSSESIERKERHIKLKRNKNKKRNESEERKRKKGNQNGDSNVLEKNDIFNKLEKLFSKRNYKIVEKIITQMLEESEHEKYLEWLSNQEKNIYIKTFNDNEKNKKTNKGINICVISKKDIVPGEIIYTEKPIVSILSPYLDQEEYCQTCFKKIVLPDNVEEKKENFCSRECELKSKEAKRLFNNIFSTDETTEKSYFSSMSSCYGISSYDIESEIIYCDNPIVETEIDLISLKTNHDVDFHDNKKINPLVSQNKEYFPEKEKNNIFYNTDNK